ncbi:MAG TPA: hypothetical protein VGC19_02040 [Rhodanobacter sp.]
MFDLFMAPSSQELEPPQNPGRFTAAGVATPSADLAHKHFIVSVDEIQKNFAFADEFDGHYSKTVTLSDGTIRTIELVPILHDGMQVIELKDTGGHTYMGLNGTTTNGKLMVQIHDLDAMRTQLKQEGWSSPIGR